MNTFPFQPGQAVLHVAYGAHNRPYSLTPAVVVCVVGERVRVAPVDGGRPKYVAAKLLVHAGFCAPCGHAAMHTASGLRCPLCGELADPTPPPPSWVAVNFPAFRRELPRRVRLAVLNPGATRREIHELARREASEHICAFRARVGVSFADMHRHGERVSWLLEEAIEADDTEGFRAILAAAEERRLTLREALAVLLAGDDLLTRTGPLEPVEDRTPDGEDDITIWLRDQMERGEQRRRAA